MAATDDLALCTGSRALSESGACQRLSPCLPVLQAQALEPFPDLTAPDSAFVGHLHPGVDERCSAKISGVYLQHLEMGELVERARRAVVSRAEELLQLEPDMTIDAMVLDLPCTFFMLRSER